MDLADDIEMDNDAASKNNHEKIGTKMSEATGPRGSETTIEPEKEKNPETADEAGVSNSIKKTLLFWK